MKLNERGIALVTAIFVMVISAALIGGIVWAVSTEFRVSSNQMRVVQAFGVAEEGVVNRLTSWRPDSINKIAIYPTDSFLIPTTTSTDSVGTYSGAILKLNPTTYMIDVTGRDYRTLRGPSIFGYGARQRVGMFVRLLFPEFGIHAALTTQGTVQLQGNAQANGTDANPPSWSGCDPTDTVVAGVRTDGKVTTGGNGTIVGNPPVRTDPTIADSTFTQFGGLTYNDLVQQATVTLGGGNYQTNPSSINGQCNTSDPLNWGDGLNPSNVCGNYFPIVHVTGNVTLNGTQGQGILLVDGDLSVQGSYQWFGVVIVQGTLKTAGGGTSQAHFWGGVLARSAALDIQSLSGKATLNYSKCSVLRILQATSKPAPNRSRSWTLLF